MEMRFFVPGDQEGSVDTVKVLFISKSHSPWLKVFFTICIFLNVATFFLTKQVVKTITITIEKTNNINLEQQTNKSKLDPVSKQYF